MQANTGSQTARFTAIFRAAHQILDSSPLIFDDPIAVGLVKGASADEIRARADELQSAPLRVLRSVFVFRSRFAEDELRQAVADGVEQYVVLGAGYDTFAYRQPAWARALRIIEVDHPASQAFKRSRLDACSVPLPANLTFCPIDFEQTTLDAALRGVGFESRRPTFFSWLGVTQYLSWPAIDQTLQFVAQLPPPTGIALTFVAEAQVPPAEQEALRIGSEAATARGEPWLTRCEAKAAADHLLQLGFRSVFHLTPELAHERYFAGRQDQLPTPVMEQLLCAAV